MKIHDRPENYVAVAKFLKTDEKSLGALVTTHKIDMYHTCKQAGVFDYFDNYAAMLEEISCISKLEGRYEGHAKDPITAGLAFEALVPPDYFAEGDKEILILGAGGSSVAFCFYLMQRIAENGQNSPRPRLVPVIAIEEAAEAIPLGRTLVENGLPIAEVTFRTRAAGAAICQLAKLSDLMLGAGTVLSIDQVKEAFDAGAQFMVTPGFNPKVVDYCVINSIPIVPGVCTPTEIEAALEYGLDVLKFFPAESMGGIKSLKAFGGPYSAVKFIPTGGINTTNVRDYLSLPNVLACGGSWMVSKKLISSKNYTEIERLTREAVLLCQNA